MTQSQLKLGALLGAQGRENEAVEVYRQVAENADPNRLNGLARLFATSPDAQVRNGTLAVELAEEAVAATGRTECNMLDTLAAAYAEAGQFTNAVRVQQEAIDLVPEDELEHRKRHEYPLRLYQAAVPYRNAGALARMALGLLEAGEYIEAEPIARACLEERQVMIPDHWLTFNAMSMLGGALLGQEQYAEAEPLLLSGYEGMKQREDTIPPQGKVRLEETLERLVQLYEDWDNPEKAAEWKQTLVELE